MAFGIKRLGDNPEIVAIGLIINALTFFVFDNLFFIINNVLRDRIDEPAQLISLGPYYFL